MNPTSNLEREFPLSGGSTERQRLRAPRLFPGINVTGCGVLGNAAFMRAWAARRALRTALASSQQLEECRQNAGATPAA
jgi:hypothetical protein